MREYDTHYIVQPEISDEGIASIRERVDGILAKHESISLAYDDQGRRRLAYEIKNFQKGRYITLTYLDGGTVVSELERTLRLDDSILRFLTVQVTDEVKDIQKRVGEAAEFERVRAAKAAERALREKEDAERVAREAEQESAERVAREAEQESAERATREAEAETETLEEAESPEPVEATESAESAPAIDPDSSEEPDASAGEEAIAGAADVEKEG